jgi:glycosyltransferase involved in cell wall biosynthesis
MKIVIASPFYPPDTEDMAVYTKELAKRLALKHDVTVVTYSRLPEKTNSVKIFSINKRLPLFFRLFAFIIVLFRTVRKADILYVENGASVELPAGIVTLILHQLSFLHIGDKRADSRASRETLFKLIRRFVKKRIIAEITDIPLSCPEILPFDVPPLREQSEYQASWDKHIKRLEEMFNHATKQ